VNYGIVIKVMGNLLVLESLMMTPSLLISIFSREDDYIAFIVSIAITALVGFFISRPKVKNTKIKVKEGLAIVAYGWIFSSFFAALPFVISGSIPSFLDALFETISGFTTTGATIINDIEVLPRGILFWRSLTHWMGGMGILVFTVAIIPTLGVGGFQVFKAESPGPISDKIAPRIKNTAKILYKTYIAITLLEIMFLIFGGMSLYEASIHTFGTVGTGGFSTRNSSIGAFDSTYIHIVISVFMILSGVNFSLYFALYRRKWKDLLKNEELRFYLGVVASATILIGLNLYLNTDNTLGISFRDSLFQSSSILTTTGYGTANFDKWPTFSKSILFILMFIGGCAGSTGGAIKNIRILLLLKMIKREIAKIFHPRAVVPIKLGKKVVAEETILSITSFFILYITLFVGGTIIVSTQGIDLESSASAVAATLGNVGPGFGFVGPTQNYSEFNNFIKLFLSLLMILGRLELFTIIALVAPKSWKNEI